MSALHHVIKILCRLWSNVADGRLCQAEPTPKGKRNRPSKRTGDPVVGTMSAELRQLRSSEGDEPGVTARENLQLSGCRRGTCYAKAQNQRDCSEEAWEVHGRDDTGVTRQGDGIKLCMRGNSTLRPHFPCSR